MKTNGTILTKEERDILILCAVHVHGKHLSNSEIGQRIGISENRVKILIHKACVKLGAYNRNEAVLIALKYGDIKLTDFHTLDDLAEDFRSLGSDMMRSIANMLRQGLDYRHLPKRYKQNIIKERNQGSILTNRERDVLILAGGYGLTNQEIANKLYISTGAVATFLNRAYTKIGANKRADAFLLALKKGELNMYEMFSIKDIASIIAPLGVESIEEIAQLIDQKLG